MIEQLSTLFDIISCVICSVLGFCFIVIPVPENPNLKNYKISLRILSVAYFFFAAFTAWFLFTDQNSKFPEFLTFPFIMVSSLQALLVSHSLITLFDYKYVTFSRVKKQLIPIATFLILFIISTIIFDDPIITISQYPQYLLHPTVIIRSLFYAYVIYQLIIYSILFAQTTRNYESRLSNYFSDTINLRLLGIRSLFISALCIGILSLMLHFFPTKSFNLFFTVVYTLFYLTFALFYINYNNIFIKIEPALKITENEAITDQKHQTRKSSFTWAEIKQQIVEQRRYLKQGVTIEELAKSVGIGRTTLSSFINNEETLNFNSWINTLRIEEAKTILINQPNCSLAAVADMTGFSEQSNFSKQFKLITGYAPSVWRTKESKPNNL